MPMTYPRSFRRRVVQDFESGMSISKLIERYGISQKSIHTWTQQFKGEREITKSTPPIQENGHVELKEPVELIPVESTRIIDLLERCTIALERLAGAWDGKE